MQAPKKSETVIPPNVCEKVLLMLENVVAKGTGTRVENWVIGWRARQVRHTLQDLMAMINAIMSPLL